MRMVQIHSYPKERPNYVRVSMGEVSLPQIDQSQQLKMTRSKRMDLLGDLARSLRITERHMQQRGELVEQRGQVKSQRSLPHKDRKSLGENRNAVVSQDSRNCSFFSNSTVMRKGFIF